jgi:protein TonB
MGTDHRRRGALIHLLLENGPVMTFRKPGFRAPVARAMRGAAMPSRLIALAVIVIVLAAGGWWFFSRPGAPVIPGVTTAPTPAAPSAESPAAPAAVVSDELTVDQLYREARKAMNENRMAAPAGNNALEFYLKIVAKQPDDSGAKDALRELFPFATGTAEDQINQGNFDEANRVIALLAQADPSNYSLTILRSKLEAKKKLADREQQAQAAAAAAARPQTPGAATTTPEGATATTTPAATPETTPAAAPAASGATATPTPADTSATASTTAPAPRPATPPPAPAGGETRDAAVTSPPVPVYPLAAARNRQEGWVEVEFTVTPEGSVQNAHVTGSQPGRIFDREAIAAVQRAKFQPKLENGQAVASTLRRRIEFKLGN